MGRRFARLTLGSGCLVLAGNVFPPSLFPPETQGSIFPFQTRRVAMQEAETLAPGLVVQSKVPSIARHRSHPGPALWQLLNLLPAGKGLSRAGAPCISPKSPPSWQAPQTNSAGTSFPETREPGRRVPGRTCTSQRSRNVVQEPPWQPRSLPGRVTGIKGIRGITLPSLLGSWGEDKRQGSIGQAESRVYPRGTYTVSIPREGERVR